ncbi:uncharacterized protein LOC119187154 isoform X1 [Rhipicephalus microplus]|uniref:uncharacterized protein LOC119187154 isoform X1 n=1 Tax=Rhipicephalus microplus TaxID=6941 RepID=UPI003F6D97CB
MSFAVVHIQEFNTVTVVPCKWIRGQACAWPPTNADVAARLARKSVDLEPHWKRYDVTFIGLYSSYEKAKGKLNDLLCQSPSNETEAPPAKRKCQRTFQKTVYLSDSDGDCNSPSVPSRSITSESCAAKKTAIVYEKPSPLVKEEPSDHSRGGSAVLHIEGNHSCFSARESSKLPAQMQPVLHRQHDYEDGPAGHEQSFQDEFHIVVEDSSRCSIADVITVPCSPALASVSGMPSEDDCETHNGKTLVCNSLSDFQRQVLHLLRIVHSKLEQQGQQLKVLLEKLGHTVQEDPLVLLKPLETEEELDIFEENLSHSRKDQLILQLGQYGGHNLPSIVRRILKQLIHDSLAAKFSWFGKKGKAPFCQLKLAGIITSAVRMNRKFKNATDHDVQEAVQSWLRHAPARQQKETKRSLQEY